VQLPFANLQVKHWNPGATAPLILPVHVICNTSDDDLHYNIRTNSHRPRQIAHRWVKSEDAHDRIAVLVGSGPSLKDTIEDVRRHREAGHDIFAMNGAAKFLDDNGITPDFQVMIDPRPETKQLIGPAWGYLIASQCSPEIFDILPEAKLYHLQIEGIDDDLPDYPHPFALVGGAASVGNTSTVLAYVLGYRTLHLYGYDSSHRDAQSHAFHQKMNDGEPNCLVVWNGKEYRTSLTMKLQAEKAQDTLRLLEGAGVKIHVHGSGLLPDMWNTPQEQLSEREKYIRMWSVAGYRQFSPGEEAAQTFLDVVKPDGLVIDFGAGTGRGALAISKAGVDVFMLDFASNCRDNECLHLPFLEHDLTEPCALRAPYGYCTDVMEHIPPAQVDLVIRNIMGSAETVFFQVATVPDNFGAVINQRLHLTVEEHAWWLETFQRLGYRVTFDRDIGQQSQFVVKREDNGSH
jgi:hypothetical protein